MPSFAVIQTSHEWAQCRYEIAQKGYPQKKYNEYCRLITAAQWTCSQTILKRHHSLELARETCLPATTQEALCISQVIQRNFNPYVAKKVCSLRK